MTANQMDFAYFARTLTVEVTSDPNYQGIGSVIALLLQTFDCVHFCGRYADIT